MSTSLDDPALVAFEQGTLEPASFRHRDHLYVAWCYLRALPLEEVVPRYTRGLRALAIRAGAASKYHATMTWAFLAVLDDAMKTSAAVTFHELVSERPDLLDRRALERFYSRAELESPRARERFVLPSRAPLP
jgi:hypothetical protein